MTYYYVALSTRSQAFLLERRLKAENINCEISYMPREIMTDLCNLGVKFEEHYLLMALSVIRRSGIPGCKVYKEIVMANQCMFAEVNIWQ